MRIWGAPLLDRMRTDQVRIGRSRSLLCVRADLVRVGRSFFLFGVRADLVGTQCANASLLSRVRAGKMAARGVTALCVAAV